MLSHGDTCRGSRLIPPHLEVADIFRTHGEEYRNGHILTPDQHRAMQDIVNCRTAVLGGHRSRCKICGYESEPSYNSCRNRHCPKCQCLTQARWIEQRKQRVLPTHYFHTVFTLPGQIRPLALYNRKPIFDLLFKTASRTLLDLGRDPNRLGALVGITAVLHTWTRDLLFHPHLHCVVTGGGLAPDGDRWVSTKLSRYLFPREVLSALFKGKFLHDLKNLYDQNQLKIPSVCSELADRSLFIAFLDTLYRKKWVVYAKRPFGGPQQVFNYLGRYTHRVAISNHRLLSMNDNGVTFVTKGDKTATLLPDEFIHRFLLHVLPSGFFKIRHFGLMASSNVPTKLQISMSLLESDPGCESTKSSANTPSEEVATQKPT